MKISFKPSYYEVKKLKGLTGKLGNGERQVPPTEKLRILKPKALKVQQHVWLALYRSGEFPLSAVISQNKNEAALQVCSI